MPKKKKPEYFISLISNPKVKPNTSYVEESLSSQLDELGPSGGVLIAPEGATWIQVYRVMQQLTPEAFA